MVFRALGNLSIRSKVVAAFAVVLALTVGLGAFAVQRLQSVESASAEIRDNWMPSMAAASRLEAAWKDYRLALARHVVSTNFMDLLGIEKEMTTMRARVQTLRADYEPLVTPGRCSPQEASQGNRVNKQEATVQHGGLGDSSHQGPLRKQMERFARSAIDLFGGPRWLCLPR